MADRYEIVNLGAMGKIGESLFSTAGVPLANKLIADGWVPCGTCFNERREVLQTFYRPPTTRAKK